MAVTPISAAERGESAHGIMTVVFLSPVTGLADLLRFPAEVTWPVAAETILKSSLSGEIQLLGAVPGAPRIVGLAENLPKGPPRWQPISSGMIRWFTVFGFDWAAGEAIAQPVGARHWVDAAHAVLCAQPGSFQLAGVAAGGYAWLPGATWRDLANSGKRS